MPHCNSDICSKTTSFNERNERVCKCTCSTCEDIVSTLLDDSHTDQRRQEALDRAVAYQSNQQTTPVTSKPTASPMNAIAVIVVCSTIIFLVLWFGKEKPTADRPAASGVTKSTPESNKDESGLVKSINTAKPHMRDGAEVTSGTHVTKSTPESNKDESGLVESINTAKPHMRDGAEVTSGTQMLTANLAIFGLTWSELQAVPAVEFSAALKNIASARGKRLCMTGVVGYIEKYSLPGGSQTYSHGSIGHVAIGLLKFIAVGSAGKLRMADNATFCGIITQTLTIPDGKLIVAVGMFDLPENKN